MKKQKDLLSYIRQYEILIASAAVLILIVILIFNMLLPNLNRANQIYAQGQILKKKLAILSQKNSTLTGLDNQYYKNVFLKLNQVLPEDKDYVSLMTSFDFLEKQSGVSIVRTDFPLGAVSSANSEISSSTQSYTVPISVGVTGTLEGIKSFLDLVSNFNGRFMVFDDVSVSNKQTGILDVLFHGRAFYYPLPTTLGPVDTALPKMEKNQEAILAKINQLNLPQENATDLDQGSIGKKNLFQ